MQVFGQSGAGAPAEIHAHVEAMRLYGQRQRFPGFPDQLQQFKEFVIGCLVKVRYVSCGSNQQVAVIVRETIEHYEASR
jgi:hypothetical protein